MDGAASEGWCTTDDGVRIWFALEGAGEPVVLCHGGPGLGDNLGTLATPLAEQVQVIRWEQRGSGRSDVVGPYTVERFVADLDQLRQHLGIERWVVGGHSWGATLALQAALAHPASARGLLYLSGTGLGHGWRAAYQAEAERRRTPGQQARLRDLKARARMPHEEIEFRALSWLPDFADRTEALALATAEARSPAPINVEANATLNAETKTWHEADLIECCRQLQVPALLLHGGDDPRPTWALASLAEALPHSQLVEMADAGHLPWIEAPQATLLAIQTFLAELR